MTGSANRARVRLSPTTVVIGLAAVAALAGLALWRGGMLDLPGVPAGLTASQAGLADLALLRGRALRLEAPAGHDEGVDPAMALAAEGLAAVRRGEAEQGLEKLCEALSRKPRDLVIGNAYRMAVFHLRRTWLADVTRRETLAKRLPPYLEREPVATLERLRREHPSRETTLQLALAWVDELMLFPALEIQAPASVESVNLLSEVLASDPVYVPALYGRGLNYLHRPARLVWPEARKAAPDAASRDLALCVAIGRRIGGAPPRLVATLALALGDAYAKEGRPGHARSWWQIAQNSSRDSALLESIRRRFAWQDDEMLDRLEAELEGRLLDLEQPLTDLSVMWR